MAKAPGPAKGPAGRPLRSVMVKLDVADYDRLCALAQEQERTLGQQLRFLIHKLLSGLDQVG